MHGSMQVEFANVILLNKTDLVSASEAERLAAALRRLNPGARIFLTLNAEVDGVGKGGHGCAWGMGCLAQGEAGQGWRVVLPSI